MGIDALADIGVAADFSCTEPLHQLDMVGAFNVVHGEVREIDDTAIFGQFEVFGIGDAPEVAVIPFVFAHRYAITIFFEKVFIGGIAVRAFPAAKLHEMATEFDFAFIEW